MLVCIDNKQQEHTLTVGKSYMAFKIDSASFVEVIDDLGCRRRFMKSRFKSYDKVIKEDW